jgi:hypothetical protein
LKGDTQYVAESDLFNNFYRRYNKVLLDKLALQREREALSEHNKRLRNMIKKYTGGMGISHDLQTRPSTLFIVNQSTNAPMRKVQHDFSPKSDANLTLAANELQNHRQLL